MVITKELKEQISFLSKKLKLSLSQTVIHILEKALIIMEKYHHECEEQDKVSSYQKVGWDTDIHIYFDKNLYRKIRHLCEIMYAFSTAIVVRKLINIYFEMRERFEMDDEEFRLFMDLYKNKKLKKYEDKKYWEKSRISKQLFGKKLYQLTFNENFMLIGFKYLL
jgi:hypothetical protein